MPLLGLSSGSAKLAKWLIREAGVVIPASVAWLTSELVADASAPTPLEWRRFVVTWSRSTPAGTSDDLAQFKIDLLNVTADELDITWTAGDYANVLTPFLAFRTSIIPQMAPTQSFAQIKAYRMRFNADDPGPGNRGPGAGLFADTGPPAYVSGYGPMAGSGASTLPYQIAPTVTFRTGFPRHWGRVYLPTPAQSAIDSTAARLAPAYRTAAHGAVKTLLGSLHDAGFYPVVPVGQVANQRVHGLLGVSEVVMDDIPDVQRRRRARQVSARTGP